MITVTDHFTDDSSSSSSLKHFGVSVSVRAVRHSSSCSSSSSSKSFSSSSSSRSSSSRSSSSSSSSSLLLVYSRDEVSTLPLSTTDLSFGFSNQDIITVGSVDHVYTSQKANTKVAVFQFKNKSTGIIPFVLTWTGKSSRDTSLSPVVLQVFNRTTSTWETLAQDNSTSGDVEFTLLASKHTNLQDYYDSNFIVIARVYQIIT